MDYAIGQLEARIDQLEDDVKEIKSVVLEIRDAMLAAKWSWRTLLSLGVFLSGATAMLYAVLRMLGVGK